MSAPVLASLVGTLQWQRFTVEDNLVCDFGIFIPAENAGLWDQIRVDGGDPISIDAGVWLMFRNVNLSRFEYRVSIPGVANNRAIVVGQIA